MTNLNKSILILGGGRYFGKQLVNNLLNQGYRNLTVLNRSSIEYEQDSLKKIKGDRENQDVICKLSETKWDLIFDQICLSRNSAELGRKFLLPNCNKYILTSTRAVYFSPEKQQESDFDAENHKDAPFQEDSTSYAEIKRFSESLFLNDSHNRHKLIVVRFPIVLGVDDYTKRLEKYMNAIRIGQPISNHNIDRPISFISSYEASQFLDWISNQDFYGPINACSNKEVTIRMIISEFERVLKTPALIKDKAPYESSPFCLSGAMDNLYAKKLGFRFLDLNDWLFPLIQKVSTLS